MKYQGTPVSRSTCSYVALPLIARRAAAFASPRRAGRIWRLAQFLSYSLFRLSNDTISRSRELINYRFVVQVRREPRAVIGGHGLSAWSGKCGRPPLGCV